MKLDHWKRIEEEFIPTHFQYLERLLEKSGTTFFCGNNPNASDISLFVVYNIYEKAQLNMEKVIEPFPRLQKILAETKKIGNLKNFPDLPIYFTSDPDHEEF